MRVAKWFGDGARAGELITHSDMLRACRASNVRLAPRRRPLEQVTLRIKNAGTLTRSLDQRGTALRERVSRMTGDERQALAGRRLALALEHGGVVSLENGEPKPMT